MWANWFLFLRWNFLYMELVPWGLPFKQISSRLVHTWQFDARDVSIRRNELKGGIGWRKERAERENRLKEGEGRRKEWGEGRNGPKLQKEWEKRQLVSSLSLSSGFTAMSRRVSVSNPTESLILANFSCYWEDCDSVDPLYWFSVRRQLGTAVGFIEKTD